MNSKIIAFFIIFHHLPFSRSSLEILDSWLIEPPALSQSQTSLLRHDRTAEEADSHSIVTLFTCLALEARPPSSSPNNTETSQLWTVVLGHPVSLLLRYRSSDHLIIRYGAVKRIRLEIHPPFNRDVIYNATDDVRLTMNIIITWY